MEKNKLILGSVAGLTALAVALPVFAQVSGTSTTDFFTKRAPLTQESVQEMITRDTNFLANIDAFVSLQKSTVQTHQQALTAAASLTDSTQIEAAVKAANDASRTAMNEALKANPALKDAMRPMGMGKGPGGHRGPNPEMLAEKLGLTADELKAALDSGKTIQQIAEEKGIDLPPPPMMKGRGHGFMHFENDNDEDDAQGGASSQSQN